MSAAAQETISVRKLTPATLKVGRDFLGEGEFHSYLLPREDPAELLNRAVTDPGIVIFLLTYKDVPIALGGFILHPHIAEAEIWLAARISPDHRWLAVDGASEFMLKHAFEVLNLQAVRTSCELSDDITAKALRDCGLIEEGTQASPSVGTKKSAGRLLFGVIRTDWQPEQSKRAPGLIARCRWDDRFPFYAWCVLQCVFLVLLGYLAFMANGAFGALLSVPGAAVCIYVDWLLFQRIRDERMIGPRVTSVGAFLSIIFSLIIFLAACYRVYWSAGFSASWLLLAVLGLTLVAFEIHAFLKMLRAQLAWLWIGSLMFAIPIVAVWIQLSDSASQWTMANTPGNDDWRKQGKERQQTVSERRAWASQRGAETNVALALSGGGYRAALIHAGVLAALDRRHVPLRYLTTVSGGSIIGAYYALGYRPADFIRSTWQQKPGLILEKLNFFPLLESWLLPSASSADIYADHFARFYFGSAKLCDLPDSPILIANATDIEANPQDAREIFSRDLAELAPGLAGSTRVADVVAASGAFPGAFEPKTIRWFQAGSDLNKATIVQRRFIDGGVLENMGLEGLKRYFRIRRSLHLDLNKPSLLIVSDASLATKSTPLAEKPDLADLLARVQDVSYSAFQRSTMAQFTGKADFAHWLSETPFGNQIAEVPYASIDPAFSAGEPQTLRVVVIAATAPEMSRQLDKISGCAFHGHSIADVQREVAAFPTLKELAPGDVEKAAWLGSALVNLYSGAIECSLQKSRNSDAVCPALQAVACPVFEEVAPDITRP